jgi:signal peptidase I
MEEQKPIGSVETVTEKSTKKSKPTYREFIDTALLILFVLIPIRLWIAQPFIVVGNSMYPTFHGGDYLVVDEISYRFKEPQRGDVIVFRPPVNPKDHFIKRIVGMPGETIEVTNNVVVIKNNTHPEGIILEEPYVSSEREASKSLTLGEDEYFVMGDNRKDFWKSTCSPIPVF